MAYCIEDENHIQVDTSSPDLGDGVLPASSHRAPPDAAPATDTFSPFLYTPNSFWPQRSCSYLGQCTSCSFLIHQNKSSLSATFTFLLELRLYAFLCLFLLNLPILLECIFCEGEEYDCLGFPYIYGGQYNAWHINSV